jgi:hypothetical protein
MRRLVIAARPRRNKVGSFVSAVPIRRMVRIFSSLPSPLTRVPSELTCMVACPMCGKSLAGKSSKDQPVVQGQKFNLKWFGCHIMRCLCAYLLPAYHYVYIYRGEWEFYGVGIKNRFDRIKRKIPSYTWHTIRSICSLNREASIAHRMYGTSPTASINNTHSPPSSPLFLFPANLLLETPRR